MAFVLMITATVTAGCGGSGHAGTGRSPTPADKRASPPAPDRLAFYQLATIIGALRASSPALGDARRRLAELAPADPGLRELRRTLAEALARVTPDRRNARRAALSAANAAYLRLLHYQRGHPQVVGLIPD